jgi:hypothetical protein
MDSAERAMSVAESSDLVNITANVLDSRSLGSAPPWTTLYLQVYIRAAQILHDRYLDHGYILMTSS